MCIRDSRSPLLQMTFHVARIAIEVSVTVWNLHAAMQVMSVCAASSLTKSECPGLSAVAAQITVSSESSDLLLVKAENLIVDPEWNHCFLSCWNKPLTGEILASVIGNDKHMVLIPWNFHSALAFL